VLAQPQMVRNRVASVGAFPAFDHHFPNEEAALKCLYLTTRSLDPNGKGKARWAEVKPVNAFAVTFEGRIQQEITDQIRSTVYLIDLTDTSHLVSAQLYVPCVVVLAAGMARLGVVSCLGEVQHLGRSRLSSSRPGRAHREAVRLLYV
jgi:hypothetical protein